jgi:transcriptional regulator
MSKANRLQVDPLQKELERIRMLLVLLLVKAGAEQHEIASALGTDQANVSRMLPSRRIKRFAK